MYPYEGKRIAFKSLTAAAATTTTTTTITTTTTTTITTTTTTTTTTATTTTTTTAAAAAAAAAAVLREHCSTTFVWNIGCYIPKGEKRLLATEKERRHLLCNFLDCFFLIL